MSLPVFPPVVRLIDDNCACTLLMKLCGTATKGKAPIRVAMSGTRHATRRLLSPNIRNATPGPGPSTMSGARKSILYNTIELTSAIGRFEKAACQ